MGENDRREQQPASGLLPNGLLPNEAASLIRPLDVDRWSKAEKRTAELIECIKPNKPSEDLREAVGSYVQRLIMSCFPCQVFTFGSVPLKTYLPDGDIDLTAFSDNENMKDTWAQLVRDMLESEEKNENAEFCVKEVQYIQAEVKIIKCLVENIVVDISFNQLGGLCTLCFLEEVDSLINQDHLFKRSIILIKAWCYYESRILGAHHGLISTYALETLVLYIFHVFNNSFAGPLEVLYRFLEFFSKFDWDNFCVSLRGPAPISSLPNVTAEPPRKDGGDLLLSKSFLEACSTVYYPAGQENLGQPFVSKHFNVIDPLRINNNLGRSVSKGNFFRIRSAFTFGAKRLARLLDCPKEDICYEVNQFFTNTWERHGSGRRPDEPRSDLLHARLSNLDSFHGSESLRCNLVIKPSLCEAQVDMTHSSRVVPSQHANYSVESTSRSSEVASVSRTQNQKNYTSSNNTRTYDQTRRAVGSNHGVHMEKSQRSSKPDNLASDLGHLFARTCSSPELTDDYSENSSQGRRDRASESGKGQGTSMRLDVNRRKNLESDNLASQSSRSSTDNPLLVKHTSSHQSLDGIADSNTLSNSYHDDSGLVAVGEEFASSLGAQGMHQEEQDLVNTMAASAGLGFSGQVHVPLNLAPGHMPLPFSPSVLASLGYLQRNLAGMVPANIPLMESPWGTNIQFPQGLISPQLAQYFPGVDLTRSSEDSIEPCNENFGSADSSTGDGDHDFWQEQDRHSTGGFDVDNGGLEMHQSDDKQHPTSTSYNLGHSTLFGDSVSTSKVQQRSTKETQASMWEDRIDTFLYQDDKETDTCVDDKIAGLRPVSLVHSGSTRSTTSESLREGSSSKVSKSTREKRGRKKASSALPSPVYGKSRSVSEHSSNEIDDDNKDRSPSPNISQQMTESSIGHVARQQTPGFEPAETSGSESSIPFRPVILGPSSQQKSADNSGTVPFAFYPTGPPVPFVTMLPVYNFPTETGTADTLTSQLNGKDHLDASDSGQNFVLSDGLDQSEILSTSNLVRGVASAEPMEQQADILNSDFASHWQNLQYGRFCQNPRQPAPLIYQSPVMVPPVYLQSRFPLEAPGRPLSTNMNLFTQLMSYGRHVLPVAPLQSVSSRPTGVYKQYVDEMPRYRCGTGTYLPNPKASFQDRHASARKGSYNYERNDHHGDREGNWNGSKSRTTLRSHNRSQAERLSLRMDRLATSENRADQPWSLHKHNTFPAHHSQNGPVHLSSTQSGANNVAYGMYPIPSMSPGGVSSNGPTVPPVVMFYPCDHNAAYASSAEQLEFGSLGPVGFSGLNEVLHLSEGSRPAGGFEGQRFRGSSTQRSSPDQPSSPHLER